MSTDTRLKPDKTWANEKVFTQHQKYLFIPDPIKSIISDIGYSAHLIFLSLHFNKYYTLCLFSFTGSL